MSSTRAPAQDSALLLDDMMCLALYQASRQMTARYRPALGDLGLTYPQYLVMVLLWQEGGSTVGAIGHRLGLESSTLSPLLKRLEGLGLVSRTRSITDERSVHVSPTARGLAMRQEAERVPDQICEATGLDGAAQADLVRVLKDLATSLETSTAAVVTRPRDGSRTI